MRLRAAHVAMVLFTCIVNGNDVQQSVVKDLMALLPENDRLRPKTALESDGKHESINLKSGEGYGGETNSGYGERTTKRPTKKPTRQPTKKPTAAPQTGRNRVSKRCHGSKRPLNSMIAKLFREFHDNTSMTGNGHVKASKCQSPNRLVSKFLKTLDVQSWKVDCQGGSVVIHYYFGRGPCSLIYPDKSTVLGQTQGYGYGGSETGYGGETTKAPTKAPTQAPTSRPTSSPTKKDAKVFTHVVNVTMGYAVFQLTKSADGWKPFGYVHMATCCDIGKCQRDRIKHKHNRCAGPYPVPTNLKRKAIQHGEQARSMFAVDHCAKSKDFLACFKAFSAAANHNRGLDYWPPDDLNWCKAPVKKGARITWPLMDLPAALSKGCRPAGWRDQDVVTNKKRLKGYQCKWQMRYKSPMVDCTSPAIRRRRGVNVSWAYDDPASPIRNAAYCKMVMKKVFNTPKWAAYDGFRRKSYVTFENGVGRCAASSGFNDCGTQCTRMWLGCTGPDCQSDTAKQWRCSSSAARGTLCTLTAAWLKVCNAACRAPQPTSYLYYSNELKGHPSRSYTTEASVVKRITGWETTSHPHGVLVNVAGKWVESTNVFHMYLDGFKVMHCDRFGSLAGTLRCRVKKAVAVDTLCVRSEAGCSDKFCNSRKDWKRRKEGLIKNVQRMVCCQRMDKTCIQNQLAPWFNKTKMAPQIDPKNWATLAIMSVLTA